MFNVLFSLIKLRTDYNQVDKKEAKVSYCPIKAKKSGEHELIITNLALLKLKTLKIFP